MNFITKEREGLKLDDWDDWDLNPPEDTMIPLPLSAKLLTKCQSNLAMLVTVNQ